MIGWETELDSRLASAVSAGVQGCRFHADTSGSQKDFAALQLTPFFFFSFPVTQSLDLLTKTRTLYFKTSSASCTTGRNKNINEVNLNLVCENPVL